MPSPGSRCVGPAWFVLRPGFVFLSLGWKWQTHILRLAQPRLQLGVFLLYAAKPPPHVISLHLQLDACRLESGPCLISRTRQPWASKGKERDPGTLFFGANHVQCGRGCAGCG